MAVTVAGAMAVIAMAVVGLGVYRFERYRYQKIEFILWDYQHEKNAGLSPADLLWYLDECGAQTALSPNAIEVAYDGFLIDDSWRVELESGP